MNKTLFPAALFAAVLLWQAARSRYFFHMMQLNSYRPERYRSWLQRDGARRQPLHGVAAALLVAGGLLPGGFSPLLTAALFAGGAAWLFARKTKEKKPFVVTDRVKRQFLATGGLFAALLLLGVALQTLHPLAGGAFAVALAALPLPVWLPLFAVRAMDGTEKRIAQGFVDQAAEKLRSQPGLVVVGITGSYGKTSVKYILSELLKEKYNTLMTPESYNTTMGVVRTVNEQLKPWHQVFVCEMGARQMGDIKEICDIVRPTYGILTSVGIAHLETFRTTENIRKTKFELVDSIPPEGLAFLNVDSPAVAAAPCATPHRTYGFSPDCDCRADDLQIDERGTTFTLHCRGFEPLTLTTRLLGRHNVLNITGAAGLALQMGVPPQALAVALRRLKPVPHRLELKNQGQTIVIDDAYNSNPEGAAEAVRVLGSLKDRRRILVTPGMVELGENEYAANRDFGEQAAACCDDVIAVGRVKEALFEGLDLGGFDRSRRHAVRNLSEALALLPTLLDRPAAVLLENDLTDDLEG